jgi:hypothetical protein
VFFLIAAIAHSLMLAICAVYIAGVLQLRLNVTCLMVLASSNSWDAGSLSYVLYAYICISAIIRQLLLVTDCNTSPCKRISIVAMQQSMHMFALLMLIHGLCMPAIIIIYTCYTVLVT